MSQENAEKCQKPLGEDNANYINTLTTELDMVKEKNKALEEMLREAEQKAQMAKSEVRNIHKYVTVRMGWVIGQLRNWLQQKSTRKGRKVKFAQNFIFKAKSRPKFNPNLKLYPSLAFVTSLIAGCI
jgi:GH35 family endo-1,4-beta-xylanase